MAFNVFGTEQSGKSNPWMQNPWMQADFGPAGAYWVDAWQRSILFLDVLRQRGDIYLERTGDKVACVLDFRSEPVLDARTFARPVNYTLVRILPPEGVTPDPAKRPFIVFDPRAGHGPGIGGMKADSEIGVVLAAGHPCYFVGFLQDPVPGQTVEDVCRAEIRFIEEVAARHPEADGKPCLIGNCQAGWQIMMGAALAPENVGPIVLAGAPLSYWAGVRGKNPLRYLGGALGGTWLTALAGDIGNGIFDGALLVANFERMNPANTYWQKPYNVYAKIDTEAGRFLDFETWWINPVLLNAGEMQWIADNLFVGNKLTSGEIRTSDGIRIDLHNIRSPIIVFCSWGDDITPPQQALGWVTDLYADDEALVASGQTIVYSLHQSIGHLGIFVSGKIAAREHDKFVNCMDAIDLLPPGLYEAVITDVDGNLANPELVQGNHMLRFEARGLADIRALGNNDAEDERRFEAVARVSEVNKALYQTTLSPMVRALTTPASAELLRATQANRARIKTFSSRNPFFQPIGPLATAIRGQRKPVSEDNPFLAAERMVSEAVASSLDMFARVRDSFTESLFLGVYGNPLLQAMVGLDPAGTARRGAARDLSRELSSAENQAALEYRVEHGSLLEAALRALVYIYRSERSIDERAFAALLGVRDHGKANSRPSLVELKDMLRDQFMIVRMDEERAIAALPALLPPSGDAARQAAADVIHQIVTSRGELPAEMARRLARVESLFVPRGVAALVAPTPRAIGGTTES